MPHENYSWNVRITTSEERLTIFSRNNSFQIGEAISFDAEYNSLTALESFVGALGCDLISGLRKRANRMRVVIDNFEAYFRCELHNPLMFLDVIGENGSPAIKQIEGKIYISTFALPGEIEAAWQKTLELSPLYQTLKSTIQFSIEYKIV